MSTNCEYTVFTFHEARDNSLLTQKSKEGKLNRLRANWLIFTFSLPTRSHLGFPGGSDGKASVCNAGDPGSILGSGRSPGEGNGLTTPVFLPEEPHGQRSLVGYSPWGRRVRHDLATKQQQS